MQDLTIIKNATITLAKAIKDIQKKQIIVIKSTILPGTMEKIIVPIIYEISRRNENNLGIIYSPEFLTEIHSTWSDDKYNITPQNEHRIVLGEGKNKVWGDKFIDNIYPNIKLPIIRTNYRTAEMIKYASNNALAAKISYWNEVFLICNELGIDSSIVAKASALDPRIGVYGTIHGKAFGGKCLPKDLKAFINFTEKNKWKCPLHKAVYEINKYMKRKYGVRE